MRGISSQSRTGDERYVQVFEKIIFGGKSRKPSLRSAKASNQFVEAKLACNGRGGGCL